MQRIARRRGLRGCRGRPTALPADGVPPRRAAGGTEGRRPFDLGAAHCCGPGFCDLGAADHVLVFTLHHIVVDGWSMGVLFRELAALYARLLRGRPSPLPPLPVQVRRVRGMAARPGAGERCATQLAWWRAVAGAAAASTSPPTTPGRRTRHRGQLAARRGELAAAARSARRGGSAPPPSWCCWRVRRRCSPATRARRTSPSARPIANRIAAEIEGVIGFFVNTLVMRTDLARRSVFAELLARVREVALGAWEHQDLPFELLVEALRPGARPQPPAALPGRLRASRTCRRGLELPGLAQARLVGSTDVAQLRPRPVATRRAPRSGTIGADPRLPRDLFDPPTIERLAEQFATLLAGALRAPETAVCDRLPLCRRPSRQQLLEGWNGPGPAAPGPHGRRLLQSVAAWAAGTPEAPAVAAGAEGLTYGELSGGRTGWRTT